MPDLRAQANLVSLGGYLVESGDGLSLVAFPAAPGRALRWVGATRAWLHAPQHSLEFRTNLIACKHGGCQCLTHQCSSFQPCVKVAQGLTLPQPRVRCLFLQPAPCSVARAGAQDRERLPRGGLGAGAAAARAG